MSLYAFDSDGFLGDVASTQGWADVCAALRQHSGAYADAGRWVTMNGRHVFIRDGETPQEALTRSLYGGGLKKPLSPKHLKALNEWSGFSDPKEIELMALGKNKDFNEALQILPKKTGTFYRGSTISDKSLLKQLKPGNEFNFDKHTSVTKDIGIAKDYFYLWREKGTKVLFTLHNTSAIDITSALAKSARAEGDQEGAIGLMMNAEHVIPKGFGSFRIGKVEQGGGLLRVSLTPIRKLAAAEMMLYEEADSILTQFAERGYTQDPAALAQALDGLLAKEYAEDDGAGRWVTMNGRHVFIREGETPEAALQRSLGKDSSGPYKHATVEEAKASLLAMGVSVNTEKGVVPERELKVLNATHSVLEHLSAEDPNFAEMLKRSSYGAGGLKIEVMKGKSVFNEEEGTSKLASYQKLTHTLKIASGLNVSNIASAPKLGTAFTVGTDFHTVLAHELGHAMTGKIALAATKSGIDFSSIFGSRPKSFWEKSISTYAGKNSREMFAEAYAAYTHPGYSSTKGLPKEVVSAFEAAGVKPGSRRYEQHDYAALDPSVQSTLINLAELARTADGVLIVSDGVVEDGKIATFAEPQLDINKGGDIWGKIGLVEGHTEDTIHALPPHVAVCSFCDQEARAVWRNKYACAAHLDALAMVARQGVDYTQHHDHTQVQLTAEEQAHYAQVKRDLDAIEATSQDELRAAFTKQRDALAAKLRSGDIKTKLKALPHEDALRSAMLAMMQRAFDLGGKDADAEVMGAVKQHSQHDYATMPPPAYDFSKGYAPLEALKWLRQRSVWATGVTSDTLKAGMEQVLLDAMRSGEDVKVTMDKLDALFAPYIGGRGRPIIKGAPRVQPEVVTPYRLENIVRTNTTAAYNGGRLNEFTKPKLARFVDGIKFLAVLDERTTEVCRYMDGKVFHPDDADLESLSPPLHFQCRSILSPVVVGMKVDPSEYITDAEVAMAMSLADQNFLAEEQKAFAKEEDAGRWVTIGGHHVLIRKGLEGFKYAGIIKQKGQIGEVFENPKFKPGPGGTFYHQTSERNVASIIKTGIDPEYLDPNADGLWGSASTGVWATAEKDWKRSTPLDVEIKFRATGMKHTDEGEVTQKLIRPEQIISVIYWRTEGKQFLDASDVHIDAPMKGTVVEPFKTCADCSGSTAPTCKANKQCLKLKES